MFLELGERDGEPEFRLHGPWRAAEVAELERTVAAVAVPTGQRVWLDASDVASVDLTGAWFVRRLAARLGSAGATVEWPAGKPETVAFAEKSLGPTEIPVAQSLDRARTPLAELGKLTLHRLDAARDGLAFTGRIGTVLWRSVGALRRLRIASVTRHVYETGLQAIPIVALIAFLISVIVAYIGAQELHQFGGEVYVVDLVSVSVLRELGVLLTSIIVAGRSGSAFAAEIGVMQLNDEVDALSAIGVDPIEVLVVPRVLGLMIALPLLTVIADAMGIAGGAVLSWLVLNIPFNQFAVRMQEALSDTTFWAGLIKAPVFAMLIAMVGTYRGLQVRDSSRELGRLTTEAVVESIFLVLLADAAFAVAYWEIDF